MVTSPSTGALFENALMQTASRRLPARVRGDQLTCWSSAWPLGDSSFLPGALMGARIGCEGVRGL